MSNWSGITGRGTPKPSLAAPFSNPSHTPTPSGAARHSNSTTETSGRVPTPPCIDDPTEDTNTNDDCEFEFAFIAGARHPVGVHCLKHDWSGAID